MEETVVEDFIYARFGKQVTALTGLRLPMDRGGADETAILRLFLMAKFGFLAGFFPEDTLMMSGTPLQME